MPIVQMLLNAGANVNTVEKEHHQTPLMYAAAADRNAGEIVRLRLAIVADLKPRSLSYDWPKHFSVDCMPRATAVTTAWRHSWQRAPIRTCRRRKALRR